jgi:hypothetical protein
MIDLKALKAAAEEILDLARRRHTIFMADYLLPALVHPLLDLLDAMENNRGERWRTLAEAVRESERGKNFFEKRLARYGGRCRLEVWQEEGLADRTAEGLWLISPIRVAQASRNEPDDAIPMRAEVTGGTPDVQTLLDEMLNSKSA